MRLFAGIFPDEYALEKIIEVQTEFKKTLNQKASWTKREKLHITLRFFGDDAEPEKAAAIVSDAIKDIREFQVSLVNLSGFPKPYRARVAFLEPIQSDYLMDFARNITPPDERNPHPHLTLARLTPPQQLPKIAFEPIEFSAKKVLLVQSILSGDNQGYHVLNEWKL